MNGSTAQRRRAASLGLVAGMALCACACACTPREPLRALFVGNSYTSVNDLPSMVGELAAAAGGRRLEAVQECPGGATLKQHWESGQDVALLERSRFDWMVLQDQSQEPSFPVSQLETDLYPYVTRLDDAARATGTRTLLFLTWARQAGDLENIPGDTYDAMQDRVVVGYETIARKLHLPVAPVGLAWRAALRARPDIALFQADGSHPTVAGTYLAACVFYQLLFARGPAGNPFTAGLPPDDASALQRIAEDTVAGYPQP